MPLLAPPPQRVNQDLPVCLQKSWAAFWMTFHFRTGQRKRAQARCVDEDAPTGLLNQLADDRRVPAPMVAHADFASPLTLLAEKGSDQRRLPGAGRPQQHCRLPVFDVAGATSPRRGHLRHL